MDLGWRSEEKREAMKHGRRLMREHEFTPSGGCRRGHHDGVTLLTPEGVPLFLRKVVPAGDAVKLTTQRATTQSQVRAERAGVVGH